MARPIIRQVHFRAYSLFSATQRIADEMIRVELDESQMARIRR